MQQGCMENYRLKKLQFMKSLCKGDGEGTPSDKTLQRTWKMIRRTWILPERLHVAQDIGRWKNNVSGLNSREQWPLTSSNGNQQASKILPSS